MNRFFKKWSIRIFLMGLMTSFAFASQAQNYGNFTAISSSSPDNVTIGLTSPFPNIYYDKFTVRASSHNGISSTTLKANAHALYATANNGTNAKAIYGASSSGYAGYFQGDTYISTKVGIGINPKSTYGYEQLAVRNGSISVDGEGNGFLVQSGSSVNDWGSRWYGLFKGDHTQLDLATGSNTYHDPVLVNGFYGIGFRTIDGKMTLNANGAVTIGLDDSKIEQIADKPDYDLSYSLYVAKGIKTEKVKVENQSNWPDYVFEDSYNLPSLQDVAQFITINKHLPDVPSAKTIDKEGIDLGTMDATLLKKIEELTLYMIQQQEVLEQQQVTIENLKQAVTALKK